MKNWIWFLSLFTILTSTFKAYSLESQGESIAGVESFKGRTWAEKVNAAVMALPATGGAIDAQGLCFGRPLAPATTNVVLGTELKTARLKLGACTYPQGAHRILYFPNTE